MGKCKRSLPADHTEHFRVKSNMNSWSRVIEGTSMREQESVMAGFYIRKRNEPRERYVRRDDSTLGNHSKFGDGFICQTNKITCFEIAELSEKYRKNGLSCSPEKSKEFRELVKFYVRSLRELGNFCLVCNNPLKAKKHFIGDGEVEDIMDKKARLRFKKSSSTKYKAYGVTLRRKHVHSTRAVGRYSVAGEAKFSAKVGASGLFYLALPDGRVANLDYIFKFKSVVVRPLDEHFQTVDSVKDVCGCMK